MITNTNEHKTAEIINSLEQLLTKASGMEITSLEGVLVDEDGSRFVLRGLANGKEFRLLSSDLCRGFLKSK